MVAALLQVAEVPSLFTKWEWVVFKVVSGPSVKADAQFKCGKGVSAIAADDHELLVHHTNHNRIIIN